jgi:hypothetical protein
MAQRIKRLFAPAQLTTSAATYYTATSVRMVLKKLTATNTTGTSRLVTIYLVVSGGSASATNTIIYQRTVLAGQTVEFYEAENHVLESGDFLQALADAATAVSFMGAGIETDI